MTIPTRKKLNRRDAMKTLGAIAGASVLANLPNKWSKPELAAGVLPAHAQTSIAYTYDCWISPESTGVPRVHGPFYDYYNFYFFLQVTPTIDQLWALHFHLPGGGNQIFCLPSTSGYVAQEIPMDSLGLGTITWEWRDAKDDCDSGPTVCNGIAFDVEPRF